MRRVILILGITLFSLNLVLACGKPEDTAKATKAAAKPRAVPAKKEAAKPKPLAKEPGQKETAKLQIYDEPGMPIRTQYPDNMQVQGTSSSEGCGFNFTFKPQGNALDQAEVHIYLPRGAATAAAQEPFVTGPNGLLANNGWKKEGEATATAKFPYGWVKKIISFSDPGNQDMAGKILLGETQGQAVQVTLYYPNELANDFLTDANLILGKLHFKKDKLPLKRAL
ncbi:MAG: hypothetical protein P8X65_08340 [Syntrophobacterales bacterium]|jgi:hypothetical protein